MQPNSNHGKGKPKTPKNDMRVVRSILEIRLALKIGILQPSAEHERAIHSSDVGLRNRDLPRAPALSTQLPPPGAAVKRRCVSVYANEPVSATKLLGSPSCTLKVLLHLSRSLVCALLKLDNLQRGRGGDKECASTTDDSVQVGDVKVSEAVWNPILGLIQELVNVTEIEASADSKLLQVLDQRGEQRELGGVHSASLETQRPDCRWQSR
ncbi:Uncharacterized protein HZ326_31550 [Fusarium oxysporum f. sp. albedinis]|nr:Uncharacterized protein HZ326_31550 [Fusarium oxysporum f. sp. albedinis]KAK2470167.1 hypothetical protein H9L39_18315 [Fusarium oxysporum f. sp. albedinis]